jgi:cytochrome c oxidase subunit I
MNIKRLLSDFALLLAICLLPHLIIWMHHSFFFGLNPFVGPLILAIVLSILILFIVKWCRWIGKQGYVKDYYEPIILFMMGALCLIITFIIFENTPVDIHLRDTFYVISYSYIVIRISFVYGIFCFIYYIFPRVFSRPLNRKLSRIHFWITYIGLTLLLGTKDNEKLWNEPYHYIDNDRWASYNQILYFSRSVLVVEVALILIAQLIFLFNIIYSFFNSSKRAHE